MPQIFHRSTNLIARASIFGAVVIIGALGFGLYTIALSPWYTGQHENASTACAVQPPPPRGRARNRLPLLPYVGREIVFRGLPPTQTCMTCHSQIWTNASMLEPVRASYRNDTSLAWTRVNALPDFVYFDHSIHVAKGIGCTTCHGQIAEMPLTVARGHALYVLVPRLPPPAGKICPAEIRGVQSVLRAAIGREAGRAWKEARGGISHS